jgi:hypothetical protein
MTHAELLRATGMTERQMKLCVRMARELPDEETFQAFVQEVVRLQFRGDHARHLAALRKVKVLRSAT